MYYYSNEGRGERRQSNEGWMEGGEVLSGQMISGELGRLDDDDDVMRLTDCAYSLLFCMLYLFFDLFFILFSHNFLSFL